MKTEQVKRWLTLGTIGIIMLILIVLGIVKGLRAENEFEFKPSIVVENNTDKDFDKYVKIVLQEIMEMDSVKILIFKMPVEFRVESINIRGFIQKIPTGNSDYAIHVSKTLTKSEYKMLVAHELVHLQQMEEGRLIELGNGISVWEGDTLDLREVPYSVRGYEQEAALKSKEILRELDRLLYK